MGWLWDTSARKAAAEHDSSTLETSPTIPLPIPSSTTSSTEPSPETSNTSSTTRATQATQVSQQENDFERILQEFSSSSSSTTPSSSSQSQSSPSFSRSSSRTQSQLQSSASPTSPASQQQQPWTPSILHPASMSCTSAFDQAMFCQIVGGQFVNYYRYGTLRNCGELWGNFWFCMRTNRGFMSDEERERRVQAFYTARENRRNSEGSSEDVWAGREESEIRPWAEKQFRWDLRMYEKGHAVLRERSE